MTIYICGKQMVKGFDVAATAGGPNRAVDLVFNGIEPRNGIIDIRFVGKDTRNERCGEAFVQAIEMARAGRQGRETGLRDKCSGESG